MSTLDFSRISAAALADAEAICRRLIPGGRVRAGEYVVCNPNRADRRPGSFKVNLRTGRWADFATGETGGDLIALTAWRFGVRQSDAARQLAAHLGIDTEARR